MKKKIREILTRHSDNKKANDAIEADLLVLFDVIGKPCSNCGERIKEPIKIMKNQIHRYVCSRECMVNYYR